MKAVQLVKIGNPLQAREVPKPVPGDQEVLIRIRAAGICHSDAHYRSGLSAVSHLPVTPGHEIAGTVERVGAQVRGLKVGDRVCVHYLVTCGRCRFCRMGQEQFCHEALMVGKYRDGGYAEYIAVPEINAVPLPEEISFSHAAVLMCSSATALHALRKARLSPGETVAVFGAGGLGLSAAQLARLMGALEVFVVDINTDKLRLAGSYGAIPVNATQEDPVTRIFDLTGGRGVDVSLELIGLPETMARSLQCLAVLGRSALVGITDRSLEVHTYTEMIGKETEMIGVSDHLLCELPLLLKFASRGALDLSRVVSKEVELDAAAINGVLDELEHYSGEPRTVITPTADE